MSAQDKPAWARKAGVFVKEARVIMQQAKCSPFVQAAFFIAEIERTLPPGTRPAYHAGLKELHAGLVEFDTEESLAEIEADMPPETEQDPDLGEPDGSDPNNEKQDPPALPTPFEGKPDPAPAKYPEGAVNVPPVQADATPPADVAAEAAPSTEVNVTYDEKRTVPMAEVKPIPSPSTPGQPLTQDGDPAKGGTKRTNKGGDKRTHKGSKGS